MHYTASEEILNRVLIQAQIKAFFQDFSGYPCQPGSSLNPIDINYTLR